MNSFHILSQATIPSLGKIRPFMATEINFVDWGPALNQVRPYMAMSDRLVLFPNNKVSTAVWDMEDDRSMGVLDGHTGRVVSAEINNVGSMAVTIAHPDDDEVPWSVKIWSLGTLQCTADLTSTGSATTCLLKDRLLLGGRDGTIKVWDIGGSAPVALMDLEGHTDIIWSITASDTSNIALSGSGDKSVRLWDLRTGQCVRVMEGHTDDVGSVSMGSACQTAVSGSFDKTVKLWDLGSGRCIQTYEYDDTVHTVMMHESGGSFLAARGRVFNAYSTAPGYTDPFLNNVDLSSMCDSYRCPLVVASRDLSRVGMCYIKDVENSLLGVSVWK